MSIFRWLREIGRNSNIRKPSRSIVLNIAKIFVAIVPFFAMLVSYSNLKYSTNQNMLAIKLAELEKFYDAAASLPTELEDYPVLVTANSFNTKNENHREELEIQNSIFKHESLIINHLNKDNKVYNDFNEELKKYFKRKDLILKYVNVSYQYLVYKGMNQETAGFSYHDSKKVDELAKKRMELETKLTKFSVNIDKYYMYLNSYYNQEKKTLLRKYDKYW
ncbi:hypothetical protein [Streptococcus sanguinis]|uniref:hypothetical protein n=1 Tax=Streptococcus sanguinis TaxID=1305 RepID=UPI002283D789|nr:hypothetical protein [Streptococcus sanguinis]MCY7019518.1 hypothetical protein [Streptococcus sanguinis]